MPLVFATCRKIVVAKKCSIANKGYMESDYESEFEKADSVEVRI